LQEALTGSTVSRTCSRAMLGSTCVAFHPLLQSSAEAPTLGSSRNQNKTRLLGPVARPGCSARLLGPVARPGCLARLLGPQHDSVSSKTQPSSVSSSACYPVWLFAFKRINRAGPDHSLVTWAWTGRASLKPGCPGLDRGLRISPRGTCRVAGAGWCRLWGLGTILRASDP
jgi:hypothetical protein